MKKYLFMLLAFCAVAFSACSDDDNNDKTMPKLNRNNTNISMGAAGGEYSIIVENATTDLNITQINEKTNSSTGKATDTNVMSIANNKLSDPKNVTEGGWFTAKIVQDNGIYRKIVFTVTQNTSTDSNRDKYIHVDCGSKLYGLSLHLMQDKASATTDK